MNLSQYWGNWGPRLETKSAHCTVVHCLIESVGDSLSPLDLSKVGVGSVEGGSEFVVEVSSSSSMGIVGEVISLRSYSSSASESAW